MSAERKHGRWDRNGKQKMFFEMQEDRACGEFDALVVRAVTIEGRKRQQRDARNHVHKVDFSFRGELLRVPFRRFVRVDGIVIAHPSQISLNPILAQGMLSPQS